MADVGTGATITFSSGYLAEITSIRRAGVSREARRTSHMGTTTWHTYKAVDLADPGTIEVEFYLDPNSPPPMTAASETVTITYPDPTPGSGGGATVAHSGFATNYEENIPFEDLMTATLTIQLTGAPTQADAT